ncbi:hypothetical protein KQX54_020414 [Cotesia glomerata]|uniref:Uncharacterized protein n=1 Tax=Cotesia glomerata TaxID=32391 RepID=A0AAV7J9L3_COTGL|nr:hypothetical protein KQX54_020414 [Cotesia glomerata]
MEVRRQFGMISGGLGFSKLSHLCISDDLLLAACMCGDGDQQFTFVEITISDVEKNLKRISTGAVGPDGIPIGYYKLLLPFCLQSIVDLLNASLVSSEFPKQWNSILHT